MINKIKEVVVVEGYHDLAKLKEVNPNLDIIITNGSEISSTTLEELKALNKTRGLILFLDPDYQGERIRRLINDYVGPTKHAFLKKRDCINKKKTKVGIEHADTTLIADALEHVWTQQHLENSIDLKTLYRLGLIGSQNSRQLRQKLCEQLGIGLSNGKTLLKKLRMFNINELEVKNIIGGEDNG